MAHSCSETLTMHRSPALSGLSHEAARSMCNLYSGWTLVALSHCPHPGRVATNGCDKRASSHSHPYTHPLFPSQTLILLANQQMTSLLVAGARREGEREAGRVGGQSPTHASSYRIWGWYWPTSSSNPWPAWTDSQQMFPAMESSWPGRQVGERDKKVPGHCCYDDI